MDSDRRRTPSSNQKKRSGRNNEKIFNHRLESGLKGVKGKGAASKASVAKADSSTSVSRTNSGTETPEVYENLVVHYVDDVNRSEERHGNGTSTITAAKQNNDEILDDNSLDLDEESNQDKQDPSDSDTARDSVCSLEEENVQGASKWTSKMMSENVLLESSTERLDGNADKLQPNIVDNANKLSTKSGSEPSSVSSVNSPDGAPKCTEIPAKPSSEESKGSEQKLTDDKEEDFLDKASNGAQIFGSEDERFDPQESGVDKCEADLQHKIEEMERRIERLEEELREVAALEISLYSVVPEHGSSAHKVHTPARRLSRLYIHACKHWTQDRKGTIAKNTVSGLILIARSCSNDVPRYINFDI